MATKRVTEQEVAESLKDEASFLVTQSEGSEGAEVESLRRATLAAVIAALLRFVGNGSAAVHQQRHS